jgi:hypothetical protein
MTTGVLELGRSEIHMVDWFEDVGKKVSYKESGMLIWRRYLFKVLVYPGKLLAWSLFYNSEYIVSYGFMVFSCTHSFMYSYFFRAGENGRSLPK